MTIAVRKNNVLSLISVAPLGMAMLFGLQACGGGGGSSAVVPDVTLSSNSISEGNSGTSNLDFTVTLSEATTVDISVDYATSHDSATAGEDYLTTSGTLTIPANSTSATISVTVNGDVAIESDESFNLQISNASRATIANSSLTVSGTINTDDLAGYYTGSSSVNGTLSTTDDLQVIAADDRLVIIDLDDQLVYIAPFENFSGDEFTTTARIYKDGDFTTTAEVNGTFIEGASIDLTLSGAGDYTTGSISLAYSVKNSVAPLSFSAETWQDATSANMSFANNSTSDITTVGSGVPSSTISGCGAFPDAVNLNNVTSEQPGRIRSFSATVDTSCVSLAAGSVLDGYFTTFDNTLADNRILFVWFNNDGVHAASLSCLVGC